MSLEDFQLLDNEPFDSSIFKKDFSKLYYQQKAHLNQQHQNNEFVFGENKISHQMGNGYLELDITAGKDDGSDFHYGDPVQLVNNGFAFCFIEARLSTFLGSEIENNKFCGQVSSILRVISNKVGD